jgi:hypothetical protein
MRRRDVARGEQHAALQQARFREQRDVLTREAYWDQREEDRKAWEKDYELDPQDQMEYTEAENALRSTQFFTGATEEEKQPAYERLERRIAGIRKRGKKKKTGQELAMENTFTMPGMPGLYQIVDGQVQGVPVGRGLKQEEPAKPLPPTLAEYQQQVGPAEYAKVLKAWGEGMGKKIEKDLKGAPHEIPYSGEEIIEDFKTTWFPGPKLDPHQLRAGGPAKEAAPTPEPAPKPTPIRRKMQELNIDETIQARFSDLLAGMGPAQQWEVEQAIAEYTRRIKEARNPQEREVARQAAKTFYGSVALGVTDPYGSRVGQ